MDLVFYYLITSLGEERANLSAFRTLICSICACLFLLISSSSWCLGRAAVCDCGTPWTFLLPFFFFFFFEFKLKQEKCLTALWTGFLNDEESESCLSC